MTSTRREDLIRALPYARRYARALTGSQPRGDALVADSLREMLNAEAGARRPAGSLSTQWVTAPLQCQGRRRRRWTGSPPQQRQLLLLTSLEEMPVEQAAPIVCARAAGCRRPCSPTRASACAPPPPPTS